jgi:hypothetical protein
MLNLEARPDIVWIDDSIRPYESIWSVLLRFSALNVIPARVLSKEFFTNPSFKEFYITEAFSANRIDHERFKNALIALNCVINALIATYILAHVLGQEQ